MPLLLILMMLAADVAPVAAPAGSIDATIRGTAQPLEVQLLLRGAAGNWKSIAQKEPSAFPQASRIGIPAYAATPSDSTVGTSRNTGSARVSGMTRGASEATA